MKLPLLPLACLIIASPLCALSARAQPDVVAKQPLPEMSQIALEAALKLVNNRAIALHLRDVTVREALAQLQTQSGVNLAPAEGEASVLDKKVSLDIEATSFGAALDILARAAGTPVRVRRAPRVPGTTVAVDEKPKWLVSFGAPGQEAPRAGVGPFQVSLEGINSMQRRKVTLVLDDAPQRAGTDELGIYLLPVPTPDFEGYGAPTLRLTRAEDEQGRSLLPEAPAAPPLGNRKAGYTYIGFNEYSVALKPLEGARKLAHLEGIATYVLPVGNEHWEVPDVLSNRDAERDFQGGGQTIHLQVKNAQRNFDAVSMELKLTPLVPSALFLIPPQLPPYPFYHSITGSIRLRDANGQVWRSQSRGFSMMGTQDGSIPVTFASGPEMIGGAMQTPAPFDVTKPLTLIFDGPTEFVQTEVPFAFENVPLP